MIREIREEIGRLLPRPLAHTATLACCAHQDAPARSSTLCFTRPRHSACPPPDPAQLPAGGQLRPWPVALRPLLAAARPQPRRRALRGQQHARTAAGGPGGGARGRLANSRPAAASSRPQAMGDWGRQRGSHGVAVE